MIHPQNCGDRSQGRSRVSISPSRGTWLWLGDGSEKLKLVGVYVGVWQSASNQKLGSAEVEVDILYQPKQKSVVSAKARDEVAI
jgi:hypothetical protein